MRVYLIYVFAWWMTLSGCSKHADDVREWRPEDHQQPTMGNVDPTRVPKTDTANEDDNPELRVARALWTVSCAGCHGTMGHGDGPSKPPNARVADLSEQQWQHTHTDAQIAKSIVSGRGMMPAFGDQLGQEGVKTLVRYVRWLGAQENARR